MFDKELVDRLLIFSTAGLVGGGAFAKLNNKNIFLGCGLGLIAGIASNYALYLIHNKLNEIRIKKELDFTKNMTPEQENQYRVSKGGKSKIPL